MIFRTYRPCQERGRYIKNISLEMRFFSWLSRKIIVCLCYCSSGIFHYTSDVCHYCQCQPEPWANKAGNRRILKHVLNNPGHEVGDSGVYPWVSRLCTSIPKGYEADLHPAATNE